jgi:hypothetical protein
MPSKVKNYLIILLALAAVSASLIAWTQSRRLASLEAQLLKASADAVAVKPKPAPVAAEFTAQASAPKIAEAADGESAATPAAEAPQRQRGNNNRPDFAALMANPEFAAAMSIQQRAALDARYGDLFKKLNLPADQLEKFKNLLLERQNARIDVMAAARESGLNPRDNRDELRKMTEQAQAEVDTVIKNTLGEGVYNQYQNYDSTQAQRSLVKQLDERLGYTATTLNSTQADFLVSVLASTGTTEQGGGGPGNWGGGNRASITDEVIQKAQSVLTPAQVSALKQLQTEQQAQQKIRDLSRPAPAATAR